LLNEFIDVANRPTLKKYFSKSDIENLIELFDLNGTIIQVNPKINICRDFKDNFLLDLAIQGNADYLISGDKDLLTIEKIEKTKIITFKDFENIVI
jgi:putative PIN family toxin of toxin-antitoxin system